MSQKISTFALVAKRINMCLNNVQESLCTSPCEAGTFVLFNSDLPGVARWPGRLSHLVCGIPDDWAPWKWTEQRNACTANIHCKHWGKLQHNTKQSPLFVLMESINRPKESINTEWCSSKHKRFTGVWFIWSSAHLPPNPVSAWFELLAITGWRTAQLLKPAVTQAYLNRDLPLSDWTVCWISSLWQ